MGFPAAFFFFAPAPLQGHAAQHGRLAGAGGGAAQGVGGIRRVPQVGQHVHTAAFDLGRLRVFVLVDHVLVDALVHQLVDFRLYPGLAEGGQVLARVAVQHQLVMHHLVGMAWAVLFFPGILYLGITTERSDDAYTSSKRLSLIFFFSCKAIVFLLCYEGLWFLVSLIFA